MEKVSVNKNQQDQSRAVSDNLTQRKKGNNSAQEFVDNRAEAETQLRMAEMINNSPYQAKQYRMGDVIRGVAQRQENKEEEELAEPVQRQKNKTGLPDNLKSGMENLSGHSLDHVKVHYNSPKPAAVQAHAYAQGSDIHLASGQEKHLPHELGHVVQQAQGRVKPTTSVGGMSVNDNPGLESEATVMGDRALQMKGVAQAVKATNISSNKSLIVQRKVITRIRTKKLSPELPRVISEIRIEGRAPTTVKGAQGDHTVAETLINESVKREVMNQQPKMALNNLIVLARLTLPEDAITELSDNFYTKYWGSIDEMEGEDKNSVIEEMIQRYIELANKREATAFLRDDELTRGNKGERKAIGGVRELADKLQLGQEVTNNDLAIVARNLALLVDMRYYEEQQVRYTMVILRAVQHAVLSVLPQLTKEQVHFMLARLMSTELGLRDEISTENQNTILGGIISQL